MQAIWDIVLPVDTLTCTMSSMPAIWDTVSRHSCLFFDSAWRQQHTGTGEDTGGGDDNEDDDVDDDDDDDDDDEEEEEEEEEEVMT